MSITTLQQYVETNRENINGLLCDLDSESSHNPNKVVKLEYVNLGGRPAAKGSMYGLDENGNATLATHKFLTFCHEIESFYVLNLLANSSPIKSFQILGKPDEYEKTITTALATNGMHVNALSKVILSYISVIFDYPNTESSS